MNLPQFFIMFLAYFGLPGLAYFLLFIWLLSESFSQSIFLLWNQGFESLYGSSPQGVELSTRLSLSQAYAMWAFVYWLCWTSASMIQRHRSILNIPPFRNHIWSFIVLLALSIQTLFSFAVVSSSKGQPGFFFPDSTVIWTTLLSAFLFLALQEIIKFRERALFRRTQRRLRLVFDTKLGMHSPK